MNPAFIKLISVLIPPYFQLIVCSMVGFGGAGLFSPRTVVVCSVGRERMLGIVKLIHHDSGWCMISHKIMTICVSFDIFLSIASIHFKSRPVFHRFQTPFAKVKTSGVSRFHCTNGSWHAHVAPTILTRRTPHRWAVRQLVFLHMSPFFHPASTSSFFLQI